MLCGGGGGGGMWGFGLGNATGSVPQPSSSGGTWVAAVAVTAMTIERNGKQAGGNVGKLCVVLQSHLSFEKFHLGDISCRVVWKIQWKNLPFPSRWIGFRIQSNWLLPNNPFYSLLLCRRCRTANFYYLPLLCVSWFAAANRHSSVVPFLGPERWLLRKADRTLFRGVNLNNLAMFVFRRVRRSTKPSSWVKPRRTKRIKDDIII